MDRRSALLTLAATGAGVTVLPTISLGQAKTAKEKIVGVWSLDSIFDLGADGKKNFVWGDGVEGLAVFTAGGHYSVQIMAANRDKSASKNPRQPVGQAIAYFGTFSIDEAAMTVAIKIARCTFPAWDGAERVSKITLLTDDEFRTETALVHDPVNGDVVPHTAYKRVS